MLLCWTVAGCERSPAEPDRVTRPPIVPLFSAGAPDYTTCGKGSSWNASDPHYGGEIDITENGVSECGGFNFTNQTGSWTGFYDFSGAHGGEWSTWRRVERDRLTGGYTDSIAQHAQVDSTEIGITFVLDPTLDLIGLQHQISSQSALPPIDSDVEAWAQIWRDIDEPVIDSVRVSHDTVTLYFTNNSRQRAIDSTLVERLPDGSSTWSPRGSVGGEAVTFIDSPVSPGAYTYRLRHVADAVLTGGFEPAPPRPNSGWVDTTLTVPGFLPPTTFWCDDDLEPSVSCHWQNSADTAAIQIQRDGVVRDTVPAGGSTWADGQVVSGVAYQYRVRHLSLDHNTVSDWTNSWSLIVEPNPPYMYGCTSSEGMIGCGWSAGEVNDTTEVHRRPYGTSSWGFLAKVTPGQTYYHDYNVQPGETWCYRARHRRQATTTVWVGPSCATVQGGPGPLPGKPGGQ